MKTPAFDEVVTPELEEEILQTYSLKRFGDAEKDVGRTVVYLCGPDSSFLTGNTISIDGGGAMVI